MGPAKTPGASRLRPRVLDLFSGIGGLALAFEAAGFETIAFSEIEPYPCKVLAQHWPEVPNLGDVRNIDGERFEGVEVVCGGFPCQDISTAGMGAGIGGPRSGLWFEMLRIIGGARPRFCLIENVPALRSRGADAVLAGLAEIGYAARPFVVGSIHAAADHERRRVWIVAYARKTGFPVGEGLPAQTEPPRRTPAVMEALEALRSGQRVSQSGVGVFVHGLSRGVDQVAALGNSIDPAVAYPFAQWIYGVLNGSHHAA